MMGWHAMNMRTVCEGLTFDDVLLIPAKSEILPSETDVQTEIFPDLLMKIPLISAAMDTVSESRLAVALARVGGIGIIHRNLSIEAQVAEVEKVKRSESGMITDPITLEPDLPVSEALAIMEHYHISGIPITHDGRLVGILTNRDLRFETNLNKKISRLMTQDHLITAPLGTTFEDAKELLHEHRIEKLPIVDKEFRLKGLITIKDIEKQRAFPHACKDHVGRLVVGAAIGTEDDALKRASLLIEAGADVIVIDTAHGHSSHVIATIENFKSLYRCVPLIAGNVATADGTRDLIMAGADIVKVGIGPSSICTTRIVAGVGIPQLTAISDCAQEADKHHVAVIADGGIRYSGDITKALAAGARAVMIGNLFAGTEESPGDKVLYHGRAYKAYRGMGSLGAMKQGSSDRYFQQNGTNGKLVPEGIEGLIPFKGSVAEVAHQLVGGLRAGLGYCGAQTLEELRRKARFIKISTAAFHESHVHNVVVTKEAPNYGSPLIEYN